MKPTRVLLADDHPLTLEGMRAFLEPHFESVGTVMDGRALVDAALRLKPDLIILDITMPLLNGGACHSLSVHSKREWSTTRDKPCTP